MSIPDVFVGQLGDGRWEISTKGTCGHKNATYLDEKPEDNETVRIAFALQNESCQRCRMREWRW